MFDLKLRLVVEIGGGPEETLTLVDKLLGDLEDDLPEDAVSLLWIRRARNYLTYAEEDIDGRQ